MHLSSLSCCLVEPGATNGCFLSQLFNHYNNFYHSLSFIDEIFHCFFSYFLCILLCALQKLVWNLVYLLESRNKLLPHYQTSDLRSWFFLEKGRIIQWCCFFAKGHHPTIVCNRFSMHPFYHCRVIICTFLRNRSCTGNGILCYILRDWSFLWAVITFLWRPWGIPPYCITTFRNHGHAGVPWACHSHNVLQSLETKYITT